jgi:YD repeat-containing protein
VTYPFTLGYNDAGMPTSVTYPDGDTLTTGYTAQGWLGGVTEQLGSNTNTLLSAVSYTGINGAAEEPTSATMGNSTYTASFTYDGMARPVSTTTQLASNQSTLFSQTRGYDNVGNVTSVQTTLPAGTDNQVFCYDDLNRLTWAGSTGTPSCGTSLTPGSLTSAAYTASYAYDTNNRLTTGPAGTYTDGNSSHVDALTSASSGYTASYDAAGDMTCRAPSSSLTCSGTATGQVLVYDQLRRLLHWQNQTNSPTTTEG